MQDVLLIEKIHSLFHNTLQYDLSYITRKKKYLKIVIIPSFCKFECLYLKGVTTPEITKI